MRLQHEASLLSRPLHMLRCLADRDDMKKGLVDAQVARQLLQIEAAVVHISSWCARLIFKRARLDRVAPKAPAALERAASQRAP